MSCRNPKAPDHRWGRTFAHRTSAHNGQREEWECNDCLAIKVVFKIHKDNDVTLTLEQIVEPPGQ